MKRVYFLLVLIVISLCSLSAQSLTYDLGDSYSTIKAKIVRLGHTPNTEIVEGVKTLSYYGEGEGGYVVYSYLFDKKDICYRVYIITTSKILNDIYVNLYNNYPRVKKLSSDSSCKQKWKDSYGITVCMNDFIKEGKRYYTVSLYY